MSLAVLSTAGDLDGDPSKLARWRDGEGAPRVAVWEITLRCDLACRHCGSRAGEARDDELSTAEALGVVDQLAEVGLKEVTLIGGEAYLRDDWDQIAAAVTARGMVCTMVSGGMGFDAERVARARDAGVRLIAISIDGLPQTHDIQRGRRGSWEAATASARRIGEAGIGLAINTQINRLTLPELPEVARQVVALGAQSWLVQLTVAMGHAADRPELLLQPYHLLDLFPMLVRIREGTLIPGGVQLFTGNNVGYFGPYAEMLRYGGDRGHTWAGCGAGAWSLGIEADGKLKGCPSLPSDAFTGGNLREHSVAALLASAPQLRDISRRTRADLWGACQTCVHADRCRGGCTWTAHVLFGRAGNNPYCHHRALDLDRRGLRERVVPVAAAPGLPFDHGRYELVVEPRDTAADDPLSPIPLAMAAELFGTAAEARSLWSRESLLRVVKKFGGSP